MEDDVEIPCIRNIVREIIHELADMQIEINKNFLTFLTKLLLTDPNWGIGSNFGFLRQNVQNFVKYVMEDLLTQQDHPKMVAIRMQFYYSCNFENMDHAIIMKRRELVKKLLPLKNDIAAATLNCKDDFEKLYKKIVYYITLSSGLGNPAKTKVFQESLVALKSILSDEELDSFASLIKEERCLQLDQFTSIVAGIRLFNKDCDKGGEGIANLPDLLIKAITVIKANTEESLLYIMEKVNSLTTVVSNLYIIDFKNSTWQMIYKKPDEDLMKINIEFCKDLLILYRQYELLIRKIMDELDQLYEKCDLIISKLKDMLKHIHMTVYMKIAIPGGVVFPLFEQLWTIWEQLHDQGFILTRLSIILSNLDAYEKSISTDIFESQLMLATPSLTDAERLAETSDQRLVPTNSALKIIQSDDIKRFENLKLEYLGFCCWKMVETDGALIPGNPAMGVVVYKNKYYVFSCVEGFQEFEKAPEKYICSVLDLARRKPQIINFFQLKQELTDVFGVEKLVASKTEIIVSEDKSIQTSSHLEDSFIDPKYRWNVWDLKREALTMTDLFRRQTRFVQTQKSSSDNSIRLQTVYKHDFSSQTKKDAYSMVPRPAGFIFGLRGRKDDKQFKIDLTRPVDE